MTVRARLAPRPTKAASDERLPSASIATLREGLARQGVGRRDFVAATGLSYEYVSRIFNNKVRFPSVRETLAMTRLGVTTWPFASRPMPLTR